MKRVWTAAAALVAALALLAGSLYATLPGSNAAASNAAASNAAAGAADGRCAANDFAKRIEGLNVGAVAAFEPLAAPVDLSALAFEDGEGEARTVADYRGTSLLLNLWATWCAPCREEMPALQELHARLGGEPGTAPFAVLPLSIDAGDTAKPRAFYAETGLDRLPFFHDGTMRSFATLKKADLAPGLPTSVFIDAEGCARGVLRGPADWADGDAIALVRGAAGL